MAREDIIEECATIADVEVMRLGLESDEYKRIGDREKMFRANAAWHSARCIAESIRFLKTHPLSDILDER